MVMELSGFILGCAVKLRRHKTSDDNLASLHSLKVKVLRDIGDSALWAHTYVLSNVTGLQFRFFLLHEQQGTIQYQYRPFGFPSFRWHCLFQTHIFSSVCSHLQSVSQVNPQIMLGVHLQPRGLLKVDSSMTRSAPLCIRINLIDVHESVSVLLNPYVEKVLAGGLCSFKYVTLQRFCSLRRERIHHSDSKTQDTT